MTVSGHKESNGRGLDLSENEGILEIISRKKSTFVNGGAP